MTPFPQNLLDRLPSESRAKIIAIDHARAAAHAAVRAAQARQAEAHETLDRVKITAAGAINAIPRADRFADEIERLNAPIAPAEAEADRKDHAVDLASVRFRMFSFLSDAEDWLRRAVSLGVKLAHQPLPSVANVDRLATVTEIRANLEGCGREWAATAGAPSPASEVKKALIAEIDEMASLGAPRIEFRARGVAPVDLRALLSLTALPDGSAIGDPAPFLIWLLRDQLVERLGDLVDQTDLEDALTDRQRDKALSQIAAKRLALEFQEEAQVDAAAKVGQIIERRRDLDPRALFEVREV